MSEVNNFSVCYVKCAICMGSLNTPAQIALTNKDMALYRASGYRFRSATSADGKIIPKRKNEAGEEVTDVILLPYTGTGVNLKARPKYITLVPHCGHVFHTICLMNWEKDKYQPKLLLKSCPICFKVYNPVTQLIYIYPTVIVQEVDKKPEKSLKRKRSVQISNVITPMEKAETCTNEDCQRRASLLTSTIREENQLKQQRLLNMQKEKAEKEAKLSQLLAELAAKQERLREAMQIRDHFFYSLGETPGQQEELEEISEDENE